MPSRRRRALGRSEGSPALGQRGQGAAGSLPGEQRPGGGLGLGSQGPSASLLLAAMGGPAPVETGLGGPGCLPGLCSKACI